LGEIDMRDVLRLAATAAFVLAASPALAAPAVDGVVSLGEYGAPTATVTGDAGAAMHNFGAPGGTAVAGYDIFLTDTGDTLYGAIVQTDGSAVDAFSNLYFDIDPTTGPGGSELGIEVGNERGFVAGTSDYFDLSSRIQYSTSTVGGLITFEFSIDNSVFRDFIAGAAAQNYFGPGGYMPQAVRLNMSQSLSYSVAGGTSFGTARLGTFSVAPPSVPEPASWAMMVGGFGLLGAAMRRRRANAVFA
jgi:hypothetical protein